MTDILRFWMEPGSYIRQIREEKTSPSFWWMFFLILFIPFSKFLYQSNQINYPFILLKELGTIYVPLVILFLTGNLLLGLILYFFSGTHLSRQEEQASPLQLYYILLLSASPLLLLPTLAILNRIFPFPPFFPALSAGFLSFWCLILKIMGVRKLFNLPLSRTLRLFLIYGGITALFHIYEGTLSFVLAMKLFRQMTGSA